MLKPDDPTQIGIIPKVAAAREAVTVKTIYNWIRLGLVRARKANQGWRIIPLEDGTVYRGKPEARR